MRCKQPKPYHVGPRKLVLSRPEGKTVPLHTLVLTAQVPPQKGTGFLVLYLNAKY